MDLSKNSSILESGDSSNLNASSSMSDSFGLSLLATDPQVLIQRFLEQRKLLSKLLQPNSPNCENSATNVSIEDPTSSLSDSNGPSDHDQSFDDEDQEDSSNIEQDHDSLDKSKSFASQSHRTTVKRSTNVTIDDSSQPNKRLRTFLKSSDSSTACLTSAALNDTLLSWLSLTSAVRSMPMLTLPTNTMDDHLPNGHLCPDSFHQSTLANSASAPSSSASITAGSEPAILGRSVRNQFDHSGLDLQLLHNLLQVQHSISSATFLSQSRQTMIQACQSQSCTRNFIWTNHEASISWRLHVSLFTVHFQL